MTKRILVIDDDELVSKTVKNLLSRQGYQVETAASAKEAVSAASQNVYHLVISDIRMPGENGIEAIRKIKKDYAGKGITCGYIFITGYTDEDTPEHAIRLGVDKFIFKPFDNQKLIESVADELALVEKAERLKSLQYQDAQPLKGKVKREHLRRVVITGIGCVAPNGVGKKDYWRGLRDGVNCIDFITSFDTTTYPSKMSAEAKQFDAAQFIMDPNDVKRMGRSSHLAIAAAKLALEDSGLRTHSFGELSVLLGSATAGIEYIVPEVKAMAAGGIKKMKPFLGIAGFGGAISSEISRAIGAKGFSHTLSDGCTSSTDAMGYAMRHIQFGLADVIVTGGADACVNDGILGAFCQMGAVSTRNDHKASRPFNKDRDGFVIAEGSWVFVFEEFEHAKARKATIYGEVIGYGSNCDAWHMSKPHPSGDYTAGAICLALADAGIEPEQVDVFEAYGNATPVNDSYETAVIKRVFGTHAYRLAVPSVKSMLGHPIGAAGAQQVAAGLLALHEGFIHPTINYEVPDPECDLDYVPNQGREGKFGVIVCNSLAFGAKNASLVLRKYFPE